MKIKIKSPYKLKQAKEGDVGFDIYANEDTFIDNLETKTIPTGVYVELPKGVECQVRPKSGLTSKGLIVHFGTVDEGYRGEIKVNATNINADAFEIDCGEGIAEVVKGMPANIHKGMKIAQLVFKRYEPVELEFVDEINNNTQRGEDGFGSTGV